MPQDFGKTFVESMQFGTKIAQEEDRMRAEQVLEGLKMDALNRQIDIANRQADEQAKYHYDSLLNERIKTFQSSFLPMKENKYTKALGIPVIPAEELRSGFPGVNIPNETYVDSQSGMLIKQMIFEEMKERNSPEAKLNRLMEEANRFSKRLSEIPEPTYKQETTQKEVFVNPRDPLVGLRQIAGILPHVGRGYSGEVFPEQPAITKPEIVTETKNVLNTQSMVQSINELAQLIDEESSFVSAHPEVNEHPAFTGAKGKMWDLMKEVQGQNIPINPLAANIVNKINTQYAALKTNYDYQTALEQDRLMKMYKPDSEELKIALELLQQTRNDYMFEQLFKGAPFNPNLGVKTQAVRRQY